MNHYYNLINSAVDATANIIMSREETNFYIASNWGLHGNSTVKVTPLTTLATVSLSSEKCYTIVSRPI